MFKIRKGDTIQVVKGKDKGKKGRVITIFVAKSRALVEGINRVKKHMRQRKQEQKGGIVDVETPIAIANIMLVCKHCAKPARVGFKTGDDKIKTRYCKSCKEVI